MGRSKKDLTTRPERYVLADARSRADYLGTSKHRALCDAIKDEEPNLHTDTVKARYETYRRLYPRTPAEITWFSHASAAAWWALAAEHHGADFAIGWINRLTQLIGEEFWAECKLRPLARRRAASGASRNR